MEEISFQCLEVFFFYCCVLWRRTKPWGSSTQSRQYSALPKANVINLLKKIVEHVILYSTQSKRNLLKKIVERVYIWYGSKGFPFE